MSKFDISISEKMRAFLGKLLNLLGKGNCSMFGMEIAF